MKKNLILSLALLLGLTACQKENKTTTVLPGSSKPSFGEKHLSLAPAYSDMTLNSDGSYSILWNNCLIRVNHISWDQVKYPTLVNGVPVMAEEISTYDGTSGIGWDNTGLSGSVFVATQRYASLTTMNMDAFISDLKSYNTAVYTWMDGGQLGTRPNILNYVKDSYLMSVGTDKVQNYTGKLIRVTTGSHLAIATVSYPLPAANTVSSNPLGHPPVFDAANTQTYSITGSYNLITSATNGSGAKCPASGTYQIGAGGVIYLVGTIIRADGSLFNFNTTVAP